MFVGGGEQMVRVPSLSERVVHWARRVDGVFEVPGRPGGELAENWVRVVRGWPVQRRRQLGRQQRMPAVLQRLLLDWRQLHV